jgi:hypothetical protein
VGVSSKCSQYVLCPIFLKICPTWHPFLIENLAIRHITLDIWYSCNITSWLLSFKQCTSNCPSLWSTCGTLCFCPWSKMLDYIICVRQSLHISNASETLLTVSTSLTLLNPLFLGFEELLSSFLITHTEGFFYPILTLNC